MPRLRLHRTPRQVRRFYRELGIDCRYILKAFSGSTSGGHESFRQGGRYDFTQVDLIIYQLGTNDAAQSYSTNTSMANINAMIDYKQKRYPKAKMLILGPPPMQDNTYEATLVSLRSAIDARVTALADPNLLFFSLAPMMDRTDANNYVTTDGAAGTRIHPNDTGLGLEWNGGYAGFGGLKAWLTANLASF